MIPVSACSGKARMCAPRQRIVIALNDKFCADKRIMISGMVLFLKSIEVSPRGWEGALRGTSVGDRMPGRPEIRRGFGSQDVKLVPVMTCSLRLPLAPVPIKDQSRLVFIALTALLLSLPGATAFGHGPPPQQRDAMTVEGTVRNSAGEPVAGATVLLEGKDNSHSAQIKTRADGAFGFSVFDPGTL